MITRNVGDVLAELKMARAAFRGTLLVLEGVSDSLFWRTKIKNDDCQITISGGKFTSVKVAEILDQEGFNGFIAIVDDDYDSFLGRTYESDNLVYPETNDLETLLASSPALEKVLDEYVDHDQADARPEKLRDLIERIKDISLFFGKLRYINRERGLNVPFERLSPWKYVDAPALRLEEHRLLKDFADLCSIKPEEVEAWHRAILGEPIWNMIQGHDFTCVLAIALRNRSQNRCNEKTLCSSLRLAYELAWFKATGIVRAISTWEARHGLALLS
ncbi:DUF4435 domain-containing protein [Paraburkholderia phenoliruptrix]|uniref:DUF4435 domain-containing protein n=1 Tax=Paraburkholderia phenoliruptrix TaxID=252970 RepID=UPI0001C02DCD|nr:DUF4435 domain-containing protein [Paraburkholderia phenoliruptrix]MDR6392256.1 hypothetical protein [Paraburkholderia phenoliruptrix]